MLDWDDGLPLGMLALVAGGRDELKQMRLVSKNWQAGFEESVTKIKIKKAGPPLAGPISERFPLLASLDLAESRLDLYGQLSCVQGLKKLAVLNLGSRFSCLPMQLFDSAAQLFQGLPLVTLSLEGCTVPNKLSFKHLMALPLTSLDLSCCTFDEIGLKYISRLPLRHLDLTKESGGFPFVLKDSSLVLLRALPLTSLVLGNWQNLTAIGLEHLKGLPLASLDLRMCPKVKNAGLAHLVGLPLKNLNLSGCVKVADRGLVYLKGMPLTSLNLCSCFLVTEAGLKHLAGKALTSLDLGWCTSLSQSIIPHILGMPLEFLCLTGTQVQVTELLALQFPNAIIRK